MAWKTGMSGRNGWNRRKERMARIEGRSGMEDN
jgi:hypothetical protein